MGSNVLVTLNASNFGEIFGRLNPLEPNNTDLKNISSLEMLI